MQSMRGVMLREARRRAGWSQARLAEAVGVDPATISRYERGEIPVPDDILAASGWALGALELLLVSGSGPFAFRPDDDLPEALDWVEEESAEAVDALRRLARAVRRHEAPDVADAEQVVDLIPAVMGALIALQRAGVDMVAAAKRHHAKVVQRYLRPEVAVA